jgi:lipopolysaccharide/colanic/teichoic acid biosynthesis glycosyltransferase
VLDVVASFAGLVALSPVLAGIALAVLATDGRPVLFRQVRPGLGGAPFRIVKFRTMRPLRDGEAAYRSDEARVTRLGRFLRVTSLDELPELWNVLRGDMSLVGPRPPVPAEVARYEWWQRRRISVRPGLTCVWQVWGRNKVSFKRWVEMDLYYIDNWSLWLDVKLILHTVRSVFGGTGV